MKKIVKNNKGITLVALVITIIILLILAGVSINLVFDEDGIIERTKQAKENMEIAQVEEQTQLNEAVEYFENLGGKDSQTNPETPTETKTVEEMRTAGTYMTEKTTLKDSNDNLIVVPEGFKIAEDSGINVTEGIVIEDKDIKEGIGNNRGNQYVWIPVGENIKKSDGTKVNITLGRYVFADGINHKDEDGNTLEKGTPILKQSAENYEDETTIHVTEITPTSTSDYEFKELKTNREGVASSATDGLNATALDLKGFVDSVKVNGGYYIARYEASYGVDGKVNSKVSDTFTNEDAAPTTREEGMLWNYITQLDAAMASRGLYEKVVTDLMNSYAWDTAIVYIQDFSEDADYSYQDGKSINSSLINTGINGDEVCKINDMASNTNEWATEYSNYTDNSRALPCVVKGGLYDYNVIYTTSCGLSTATAIYKYVTFRSTLYF